MTSWDPAQYLRFADERGRPFFDLLHHLPALAPRSVADIGCGPGGLTAALADRFPEARVVGVDLDQEMIAHARRREIPGRLSFVHADLRQWRDSTPHDLVVSNACLHWVDDHAAVLGHLLSQLAPGGVLAFQVPNNFAEPSHQELERLLQHPEWHDLAGRPRAAVHEATWYVHHLARQGLTVHAWETTYLHLLAGPEAITEWMAGSTLRPLLSGLDPARQQRLKTALTSRLEAVYPRHDFGTVYPFRRIFVIARK